MRHLAKLGATGVTLAVVATGCGGANNILHGRTPAQIVRLASAQLTSQSYRMSLHATIGFDASGISGLPSSALEAMGGAMKNVTLDGQGEVQDPRHLRMSMSMQPFTDKQMVMVLYDGTAYLSTNGGSTFANVGSFDLQGMPMSPADVASALEGATGAIDLGPTVRDGQRVEHLAGRIGKDFLEKSLGKMTASGSLGQMLNQFGAVLAQAFSIKGGAVDLYVRPGDGRLVATAMTVTMAIDMGKLLAAMTSTSGGRSSGLDLSQVSGAVTMTETATTDYTDYGAKITVTRPQVDPNAPGLPGGLFG